MLKKLSRPFWSVVVVLVIVAAFLVSLARVLLPLVSHYRTDIEDWIHSVMGYPVEIGELDAVWKGLSPTLELRSVSLRDQSGAVQLFVFDDVSIELDIFRSLVNQRVEPGAVVLRGLRLTVERKPDGALELAGIFTAGKPTGETATDPRLTQWFLSRKMLSLEDAEVSWHDRFRGREPVTFTDVNLTFANAEGAYIVAGSGDLPSIFGRRLEFRGRFVGSPAKPAGWCGETYMRARGVRLAEWYRSINQGPYGLERGIADAELWSVWSDGRLDRLEGELSAYALELKNKNGETMPFDAVSSQVKWQRDEAEGWTLLLTRFMLAFDNHAWVPTTLGLKYSFADDKPVWEVAAEHLVVQDVLRLARFALGAEGMPKLAEQIDPRGDLFDVYTRVRSQTENSNFFFRCRAQDLAASAHGKIPGMSGVDAVVYADNENVLLNLNVEKARVMFPRLFRRPLEVDRATGAIVAQRGGAGWSLWSDDLRLANRDIAVEAALDLSLPSEGVPEIDLAARYFRGKGESTSTYLPVGIMKQPLIEWLDRAIVGGRVVDGGFVLRGPLNKFPFRDAEGRFEVRFNVQDGQLAYAPGWPTISDVEAEVVFSQQALRAHAERGKSLGADLSSVDVEIKDLKFQPEMTLKGRASGPAAAGWRHVTETPLRKVIGEFVAGASVSGQAELDLALNLPLHDHLPLAIDGKIKARNVGMVFGGATPLDIVNINGQVGFSETGLSAEGVSANVLGQPATVAISTGQGEFGHRPLNFRAEGSLSMATLRRRLPLPVLGYAEGSTRWRGSLKVMPLASNQESELKIESDLQGVAVALPRPAGKPAAVARDFELKLGFGAGKQWPLRFVYGDKSSGEVVLEQEEGVWTAAEGVIRYGDDDASLVDRTTKGLQLVARVKDVKLDDYLALGDKNAAGSGKPPFSRIAVVADRAELWGQSMRDLKMSVLRGDEDWLVVVDSDRAKGRVSLPVDSTEPIKTDFDYLRVAMEAGADASNKKESDIDPRELRPIEFASREFSLGDLRFGSARASLVRAPGGMRLNGGELRNGPTSIRVEGAWTFDGKSSSTVLNAGIDSSNFGETLSQLGYANTIEDGEGATDINVRWRGSPMDYDGGRLNGDIRMRVAKGRVLEVEPGAGRILGILSVQSLPRRLTLDFSDVFAKGFAFDKIDGQFTAREGVATVDAFELKGPSAYLTLTGKIDLGRKTYDQRVKVIPNLTGNLPIAVGVIVGSPVAGAAMWLAEKVFRRPIGDLTQVNYRVTGPWQQPLVERLTREEMVQEEKSSAGD